MITVLVVSDADRARALDEAAGRMPSLELLHAADVEQALDRLARNRRIDAVLLLRDTRAAAELARLILEEDPGAPPLYVVGIPVPGAQSLPAGEPRELLGTLERSLNG
jgi:hypothetical protein